YMKNAGAGWTRINFRLSKCFLDWTTPVTQAAVTSGQCHSSTLGRTATDQYVQVVRAARAQGLHVLGLLSNETVKGAEDEWRLNNAENYPTGNGNNAYISKFAAAAKLLAGRFAVTTPQPVEEWEVWNEPNAWEANPSPGVFTGSSFIYPSNFAQLLIQANRAIKDIKSGALVVSGGLF